MLPWPARNSKGEGEDQYVRKKNNQSHFSLKGIDVYHSLHFPPEDLTHNTPICSWPDDYTSPTLLNLI